MRKGKSKSTQHAGHLVPYVLEHDICYNMKEPESAKKLVLGLSKGKYSGR